MSKAIESNVHCGYCDGFFYVIPEEGVAFCPCCETAHFVETEGEPA